MLRVPSRNLDGSNLNIQVRFFPALASNTTASSIEIRPLLALFESEYLKSEEIVGRSKTKWTS